MIGENIKRLRTKNGMTQKELADKLFVTAQAVSRWENEDVEPSISTISEIAKIFNVSTDEILGVKSEPRVVVKKEIVYKDAPKQPLTMCNKCKNFIYEKEKMFTYKEGVETVTICNKCKQENIQKENEVMQQKLISAKTRRIHSFVWGGVAFVISIVFGIIEKDFLTYLVLGVLAATYTSCLFLKNNFIPDVTISIMTWGFVTFPRVIFELSLDGLFWLISVKLLFLALGVLIAIVFALLAIFIGALLSVFVYPFAIVKNFRNPLAE